MGSASWLDVAVGTFRREVDVVLLDDGPASGSATLGSRLRRGLVRKPLLFAVSWLSVWSSSLSSCEAKFRAERRARIAVEPVEFCEAVGSSGLLEPDSARTRRVFEWRMGCKN